MNEQEDEFLPCYSKWCMFFNYLPLRFVGVRNTSIPSDIKNQIEDIMYKTSKNLKKDKVANTLKLLETYLPDIMRSVHEKLKNSPQTDWTENESRKLNVALRFYPTYDYIRDSEERWRHIHGFVNTKTVLECKEEVQLQEVRKSVH